MSTLSDHLKAKRMDSGLSLSELARLSGLSKGYLHTVESGETEAPSVNVIDAIAQVYGQRAGDLLVEAGYTAKIKTPVRVTINGVAYRPVPRSLLCPECSSSDVKIGRFGVLHCRNCGEEW